MIFFLGKGIRRLQVLPNVGHRIDREKYRSADLPAIIAVIVTVHTEQCAACLQQASDAHTIRCAAAGKFIDEAVVGKDADRFLSLLQNTAQPFHLLPVFLRGSVGIEQYAAYAAAEKRLISLLFAEKGREMCETGESRIGVVTAELLEGFTLEEQQQLNEYLGRIARNMERVVEKEPEQDKTGVKNF